MVFQRPSKVATTICDDGFGQTQLKYWLFLRVATNEIRVSANGTCLFNDYYLHLNPSTVSEWITTFKHHVGLCENVIIFIHFPHHMGIWGEVFQAHPKKTTGDIQSNKWVSGS